MLIGYVSDERYVALGDVLVEFINTAGESWETRSRASGAIHANLPPGEILVTLSKDGYGSKRVRITPKYTVPYQFRLLSDSLLGYAWPKCVRSGEVSEFRVHSVEPYKIEITDFPRPEVDANSVLIRLDGIGICGSNLHWWTGGGPATRRRPRTEAVRVGQLSPGHRR